MASLQDEQGSFEIYQKLHFQTTQQLKAKFETGLKKREETLENLVRSLGRRHAKTVAAYSTLGRVYELMSDTEKAIEYLERAYEGAVASLGYESETSRRISGHLSRIYTARQQFGKLISLRDDLYQFCDLTYRPFHLNTLAAQYNLLLAHIENGNSSDAKQIAENLLRSSANARVSAAFIQAVKQHLAACYGATSTSRESLEKAVELQKEALEPHDLADEGEDPRGDGAIEEEQRILMGMRFLRELYTILGDWQKAIDCGKQVLQQTRLLNCRGSYSDEYDLMNDHKVLMSAFWRAGQASEAFQHGLEICRGYAKMSSYPHQEALSMALEISTIMENIEVSESDYLTVFEFLWSVGIRKDTSDMREGAEESDGIVLQLLARMEQSASDSLKAKMELAKMKVEQPNSPAFSSSCSSSSSSSSSNQEGAMHRQGSPHGEDKAQLQEHESTVAHKTRLADHNGNLGQEVTNPERRLQESVRASVNLSGSMTREDRLYEVMRSLKAKKEKGEAQLVSEGMSDAELLRFAEELDCRRHEYRTMRLLGVEVEDFFADWPPLST